jgi:hypothetical protein
MALDNEQDWQLFFEGSFARSPAEIYEGRIESIFSPPLFNKSIIRILVRSASAKKTWLRAGTLIQEIGQGMEFEKWEISLDRKTIIQLNLNEKYRLRLEPVRWLSNLYLTIDTYEG